MTINVNTNIKTVPLGDRIDHLLFCHIISQSTGEDVNLICKSFRDFDLLKDMLDAKSVFVNKQFVIPSDTVKYKMGFSGINKDLKYTLLKVFNSVKEFPKCKNIPQFDIELPKKYVTAQWDAKQTYRYILPERIEKIEAHYRKEGYEIIPILGSGTGKAAKDLDYVAYIISKADLHIGASSGGVYFSKIILPSNKIHIYSGEEKFQARYPNGVSLSKKYKLGEIDVPCQLIIDKGAKLNYCERT